jgi:hypothetical protein
MGHSERQAASGWFSLCESSRIGSVLRAAALNDVAIEHRGRQDTAIQPHSSAVEWVYRGTRRFPRGAQLVAIAMISFPTLAGFASTVIFMASTLPMLVKARRSRNLTSYSWGNIALANLGNAVNSVYVYSLPPGPIWLLHTFYLVSSALMLGWYLRYGTRKAARSRAARMAESPNAERARADHVKAGDEVFGHVCSRPRARRAQHVPAREPHRSPSRCR